MTLVFRVMLLSFFVLSLSRCSNETKAQRGFLGTLEEAEKQNKRLGPLDTVSLGGGEETPPNFKVALFGDTGVGPGYESVLELVKKEKADMAIHLGDFSYYLDHHRGAEIWNEKVNSILGEKFPYFLVVGNHESSGWDSYIQFFYERLKHLPKGTCTVEEGLKDLGVKSYCNYKGVFMLLSGVGTKDKGPGHETFIAQALERNKTENWSICAWHKNQNSLQLGHKINEVGWEPYKLCEKYGALVATGHEHSYGRTRTLTNVGHIFSEHGATGPYEEVTLAPGKNFVSVIGTGGKSFRPYNCLKGSLDPWWASIYTTNYVVKNGTPLRPLLCLDNPRELKQDDQLTIEFGALFLELNYEGDPKKAKGRYVTTHGRVLDEFMITKEE